LAIAEVIPARGLPLIYAFVLTWQQGKCVENVSPMGSISERKRKIGPPVFDAQTVIKCTAKSYIKERGTFRRG
jgi:hypothetical protein